MPSCPHRPFTTTPTWRRSQCDSFETRSTGGHKQAPDKHNIEQLRRELEQAKDQAPFTITRSIEWLSKAANSGGGSIAFQAFKWVLGTDHPPTWRRPSDMDAAALVKLEQETDPEVLRALTVVLLIPKSAAVKLIYRCPAAARVSATDLMTRLVSLKDALPGCDVARMVELVPTAFLAAPLDATLQQIESNLLLLRHGLEGADIDSMLEADPTILFESTESIKVGLDRMRELWGELSPTTLAASDPEELALAVRALGLTGPPKYLGSPNG